MRTRFSLFSLVYQSRRGNIGIIYSRGITTSAVAAAAAAAVNGVVNVDWGPGR